MLVLASVAGASPIDAIFADGFESGGACAWTTGGVQVSWTVNSGPASTNCPPDSVVVVVGTSGPLPFERATACAEGTLTVTCLPPGPYVLVPSLEAPPNFYGTETINVTILAGAIASVSPVNFSTTVTTGTASITWVLVNSDVNPGFQTPATCPPAGTVEVAYSGPSSGGANSPCSIVPLAIPDLLAGSYTFDLTLTDPLNYPGQSAQAEVIADVIAGAIADIQVTIECPFCPLDEPLHVEFNGCQGFGSGSPGRGQ